MCHRFMYTTTPIHFSYIRPSVYPTFIINNSFRSRSLVMPPYHEPPDDCGAGSREPRSVPRGVSRSAPCLGAPLF